MTISQRTLPVPAIPCCECYDDRVPTAANGVLVWCEHTCYGGQYDSVTGRWHIQGPFDDLEEFVHSLYDACTCVFHADGEAEEMHGADGC